MSSRITFSVIMPVYNCASYVRDAIDSVCRQTFTDWELICVDDGSTDGSAAILDEMTVKDSRVRVVHQDNQGVAVARNRGLDEAMTLDEQANWLIKPKDDEQLAKMILRQYKTPKIQKMIHDYDISRMVREFLESLGNLQVGERI